jgi:hypothetical protein
MKEHTARLVRIHDSFGALRLHVNARQNPVVLADRVETFREFDLDHTV